MRCRFTIYFPVAKKTSIGFLPVIWSWFVLESSQLKVAFVLHCKIHHVKVVNEFSMSLLILLNMIFISDLAQIQLYASSNVPCSFLRTYRHPFDPNWLCLRPGMLQGFCGPALLEMMIVFRFWAPNSEENFDRIPANFEARSANFLHLCNSHFRIWTNPAKILT